MMPQPLHNHHLSVCGLYTIYSTFELFEFRQQEVTEIHDFNVLSFKINYMYFSTSFALDVQSILFLCLIVSSSEVF